MEDLLQLQLLARQQRTPYAVATIVEATGSTPRTEGKMLVYADGRSAGTIGGGLAELRAKKDANDAIRCGKNRLVRYEVVPQAAASGMACGGALQVFIEVYGTRPLLVVCGGGHVGTCVLRAAKLTGFELWLFDDRPQEAVAEAAALADRFFPVAGDFYEGIAAQAEQSCKNVAALLRPQPHAGRRSAARRAGKGRGLRRHARQPEKDRRAV